MPTLTSDFMPIEKLCFQGEHYLVAYHEDLRYVPRFFGGYHMSVLIRNLMFSINVCAHTFVIRELKVTKVYITVTVV